jgi:TPP-dependent pyruvate/acetoin dehydrogenase alpha subunit
VSSSPTDGSGDDDQRVPDGSLVEPAAEAPEVPPEIRLALFRLVLLQRITEERIMSLYLQGRIPGSVYTGRGQEAVAAAAGLALGPEDVVAPANRELATHLARGVPVAHVLRNYLGKATGPTRGRDGNMHFGAPEHNVFPLVSMLGTFVPVTVGAALAFQRRNEPRVALTFFGDGTMSTGDVHEGLNLAAVLHVPAVFVLQNNGYAYSTPIEHQMANTNMSERVRAGWGIPCDRVDGTDALAVYVSVLAAVERARAGNGPQAVEALTLRMQGHAAHDDGRYMDRERLRTFADRFDPVERLAARLRLDGLRIDQIDTLRQAAIDEVSSGLAEAEAAPAPDPATLADGVYAMPPEGT